MRTKISRCKNQGDFKYLGQHRKDGYIKNSLSQAIKYTNAKLINQMICDYEHVFATRCSHTRIRKLHDVGFAHYPRLPHHKQ